MRTDRLDRVYVLSCDNLNRLTREDWWQIEDFPSIDVTTSAKGTSAIAWDASADTVDAAWEALSNIGAGDVSVATWFCTRAA